MAAVRGPRTAEWRANISKALKGRIKSSAHIENLRLSKIGKKQSSETIAKRVAKTTGQRRSKETRQLMSDSAKQSGTGKWNKGRTREQCPIWRGKSSENELIRNSTEMKAWRKAVFIRDDYTCQICLVRGGTLQADHIKPFALFVELRFDLSNGRTLCVPCHRGTDTWGYRKMYSNGSVLGAIG